MYVQYISLFLLILSFFSFSYQHSLPFTYTLSGYIKGELYGDSRQTIDSESDDQPFFPSPHKVDPIGQDINARGQTQMDAFETRLRVDLNPIHYEDFILEGVVEADFEIFFPQISDIFHMRYAYGKISWKHMNLLFGQFEHPMVLIETLNINYNGSTPFDYYARSPQLTFTYETPRRVQIITTAAMEVDYTSDGPDGSSSQYMRWATIPNLHFQLRWLFGEHMIGVGGDYKRIAPRLASATGFRVYERLSSGAALCFLVLKWPVLEFYLKGNVGQNTSAYNGLGGYAVQQDSINPITGQQTYTNLWNAAVWLDISVTRHRVMTPGIFIGVSKNFGARKKIDTTRIFGFGNDVDIVFRISPRLMGKIGSVVLAAEVEYTRANYGDITDTGNVINTVPSECIRPTFAGYYYF